MSTLYFVGALFTTPVTLAWLDPDSGGVAPGALNAGLFTATSICHVDEERRRFKLQERLDALKRDIPVTNNDA